MVDKAHDPVVEALLGQAADGEVVQPNNGKLMSALSIDLESRDRVKLAGKMVVGTAAGRSDNNTISEAQLAMLVQESLGNCPKYLNKKTIRAHLPSPELISSSLPLPPDALSLIDKADMFFVSSTNGQTMDTNHRGGPAGFVRVVSNSPSNDGGDGVVLVYPEYSGNRLYQTLGNLHTNPLIGIAIPDYTTSDILYLTGSSQLLVGATAASLLPHTSLAVKITVHAARLVKNSLPFRGTPGEPSPYNPPVRRLATEQPSGGSEPLAPPSAPLATATLLRRELLTPTIARFTFLLRRHRHPSSPQGGQQGSSSTAGLQPWWQPGQHVTLSFASELDLGYSHMRDADPQSLNDDFVRTFTISNPPPPAAQNNEQLLAAGEDRGTGAAVGEVEVEVQLTLRRHGPATGLLFAHPLGPGAGTLEVPVLGIGGEEGFRLSSAVGAGKKAVFVAGGIGITPLLAQAQAPGLLSAAAGREALEVLWSVRGEDLGLVVDTLERVQGLGSVATVFVTGNVRDGEERKALERVKELGARAEVRRMGQEDVLGVRDAERGTKYFASVLGWLGEEEVVFESFEY
ncbi:hypothetical protein NEMBOFW57_008364 [Staphylotrichum longicolle]|uniref:FAD-binding FR-type domain-containing protein n=1 Tax=Staphylotrichum longicolle TaxID=669026 RepID=A0AAD4ER28_9PEZI|nr:hypothetical protein NEMBOFW57_008364 [Staphylotrichum longicolle]